MSASYGSPGYAVAVSEPANKGSDNNACNSEAQHAPSLYDFNAGCTKQSRCNMSPSTAWHMPHQSLTYAEEYLRSARAVSWPCDLCTGSNGMGLGVKGGVRGGGGRGGHPPSSQHNRSQSHRQPHSHSWRHSWGPAVAACWCRQTSHSHSLPRRQHHSLPRSPRHTLGAGSASRPRQTAFAHGCACQPRLPAQAYSHT